jgi:hypothetical protein
MILLFGWMEQDHLLKYVCEFIKINKKMMGVSANLNGEMETKLFSTENWVNILHCEKYIDISNESYNFVKFNILGHFHNTFFFVTLLIKT